MISTSNIVPSAVQTGCLKGWRLAAQKLKGSLLKEEPFGAFCDTFEPALAEYASEDDHSECVICNKVSNRTNKVRGGAVGGMGAIILT